MYGQQITQKEELFEFPNILENTQDMSLIIDKISVTLVLEPQTHFSSPDFTNFRTLINTDNFPVNNATSFGNTFGQIAVSDQTDLQYNKVNSDMFKTDKLYEIYLDSFSTFDCKYNNTKNNMAFKFFISNANIKNTSNILNSNEIIIPNNTPVGSLSVINHKDKKYNYISTVSADKIAGISGQITMLDGTTIFKNPQDNSNTGRIILSLLLVPK